MPTSHPVRTQSASQIIIAATLALFVVHGFGRFVFTPLIPLLIDDGFFDLTDAAHLASWNYTGYLIGALFALLAYRYQQLKSTVIVALAGNTLITGAQIFADNISVLIFLRLINGITNGLVFVLAPAIVLEVLAKHNRIQHSGLVYLGVCVGILASDQVVKWTMTSVTGADRWLPSFLFILLPTFWACWQFSRVPNHYLLQHKQETKKENQSQQYQTPLWTRATTPLFLAYACAGIGYILPMTFLPALSAEWSLTLTPSAWLIAALASIPSVWLWNYLGSYLGDKRSLIINYWIQALGVAAIVVLPFTPIALWLCAVLVGSTFIGTVSLTQRLARQMQPHQGPKLSAALISLYGVWQLAGPILTEILHNQGVTLGNTFLTSSVALFLGGLLMMLVPKIKI